MANAWMLRQDGKYWPVTVHLYCERDADLSSEAEVAAFLIYTQSKDSNLSKFILDAWMAKLIESVVPWDAYDEDICNTILQQVRSTPYKFAFPLSSDQLLAIHKEQDNYKDVDTLYEFLDYVDANLDKFQSDISKSLNQQFCRVRYGGTYDTVEGDSSLWFRISSVGFNWRDVIYMFVSEHYRKLHVGSIYICRDYESDNGIVPGKDEYFYKAKDGATYYDMPISEYLEESHESSPVFATQLSSGVYRFIMAQLSCGDTYEQVCNYVFATSDIAGYSDIWNRLLRRELKANCICESEFLENAPTRTQNKLNRLRKDMLKKYPELTDIDIDVESYPNREGKMVGKKYIFTLYSMIDELDRLVLDIPFTKSEVSPESLMRRFRQEYEMYKEYKHI